MPVNPEDYNSDAISGEKLLALMQDEVYDRLKGDVPESLAVFLCSLKAQVDSIQKAMAEQNLGDAIADSLDAQSLKVGGTDVKTKQAAKSNPSASSGSANTFVDTLTQNENGELTATRRVMKMYSGTGTNTDAPMTQKATKDALDTKAPIASPTFTGTPAAPTASGSTYTTQIATTAFVHDAIENDLKKAADVSGMGNDDTHAYSGEAVSMAISSAVSGNVGGFLGNMTVAQINAYTNPKMGDNAIVTDTGTITVGSEQCVITTAPSEVRWTTSGSWKISSAGYVRDTQYATNSVLGLVKTSSADGGVSLNSNNQMQVNGWSDVVFTNDARLLSNADEFVATYSTQSSGTTMEELITAYNAGKKISVLIGGAIGPDTYAMKVPLSYVRVQDGNIVGFYFETHVDPVRSTSLAGSMITYWRTSLGQSSGWGSTSGDVAYAVASSTAAVADAASDAVANSNLATMIAARMLANASNAESGALTALMAQLSKTLLGVTGGTEIVTSYPSDNGFDTSGHVNQPYRIKLSAIATYMASALVAGGSVATPPRVKVLNSPYYYQNGSASSNVKMHLASASTSTYYSLGNRLNDNYCWGICRCPESGSYVEIDFDISVILTTGDIQFSEIPYIMSFCATCHDDFSPAYTDIPSSDSYIFALANLTVGNISNSLYSFAHVRMCGYIPNGTFGKAIFVGGCVVNGITGTNIAAVEMKNVKVIAHTKTFELT